MNPDYQHLCRSLADDFILKSTRFSINNIEMQSFEAFDYDFEINCRFQVMVRAATQTVTGLPAVQNGDLICESDDQYQQALREHAQVEMDRSETLDELTALVRSEAYGAIDRDCFLHQYDRRILHHYACPACGGHMTVTCGTCKGSGRVNCGGCGGSGRRQAYRTVYDSYTQTNRVEYYHETCGSCLGQGKIRCSSCGGRGQVTCGRCRGQGSLTDVSLLNSWAVPQYSLVFSGEEVADYIREALYKAGLPRLGDIGQVTEIELVAEVDQNTVRAGYAAVVPFARFRTPVKQSRADWVLYGDPPCILDSGQILEVFLMADFEALKRVASRGNISRPFIAARSRRALADFMGSEIHQDLLEGARQGLVGNDLRERLNRAFSQSYIDESLAGLAILTRSIIRWSNVKWLLGLTLIIYSALAFYWAAPFEIGDQIHTRDFVYYSNSEEIYYPKKLYDHQPATFASMSFFQVLAAKAKAIGGTMWELGFKIGLIFSVGALLACWYRNFWFKRTGGKVLLNWVKSRKINKKRFIIFFFTGLALLAALIVYCPYWVNNAGLIFGLLPRLPLL